MTLNPALVDMVAAASVDYEDSRSRELLQLLISNRLERTHATPDTVLLDYMQEAAELLQMVESWCIARRGDGELIFRDPADEVATLNP